MAKSKRSPALWRISGCTTAPSRRQARARAWRPAAPQSVVGPLEVVGDPGGAEPGGDGASAAGEQGAQEEGQQTWGRAGVQGCHHSGKPGGQQDRQLRQWHGRLLGTTKEVEYPSSCSGSRLVSTCPSTSCLTTPRARSRPKTIENS